MGKGSAFALRGSGARVFIAEERRVRNFLQTDDKSIITLDHMKKLKYDAIFGSTGHFDNKFDWDGSERLESRKVHSINPYKNFISSVDH